MLTPSATTGGWADDCAGADSRRGGLLYLDTPHLLSRDLYARVLEKDVTQRSWEAWDEP